MNTTFRLLAPRLILAGALAVAPLGACAAPAAAAQPARAPAGGAASDASLLAAEAAFMEAFNALDQARFDAAWAEDATVFFPRGPFPPERVVGKAAVTAVFKRAFDAARARNPAARLNIKPLDVRAQAYGDLGIVTFELDGGEVRGRRTLVMRRAGDRWLIVHLHASEEPAAKPAR